MADLVAWLAFAWSVISWLITHVVMTTAPGRLFGNAVNATTVWLRGKGFPTFPEAPPPPHHLQKDRGESLNKLLKQRNEHEEARLKLFQRIAEEVKALREQEAKHITGL